MLYGDIKKWIDQLLNLRRRNMDIAMDVRGVRQA